MVPRCLWNIRSDGFAPKYDPDVWGRSYNNNVGHSRRATQICGVFIRAALLMLVGACAWAGHAWAGPVVQAQNKGELGRAVDTQTNLQVVLQFQPMTLPGVPSGLIQIQNLARVPINHMLTLTVSLKPLSDSVPFLSKHIELLKFDAIMPEHKHGMVVTPSITKAGESQWRIDGVKFHMPGYWECLIVVKVQSLTKELKLRLYL